MSPSIRWTRAACKPSFPAAAPAQASQGGLGAFTGTAVANQFTTLAAQQETLTSLASDTGGTAFTDTQRLRRGVHEGRRDISSYYILGFSSTNPNRDGRFRRLTVRLRNRTNAEGGGQGRATTPTATSPTRRRADREVLLQEQLATPIPATDVPLFVTAGWFRLAADRYYVPISLAVPGSAVPPSKDKVTLDVAGFIRDERGVPVGRIRDTLTVPAGERGRPRGQAGALSDRRDAAAGPLLGEDRRPRERDRPDGNVRNSASSCPS